MNLKSIPNDFTIGTDAEFVITRPNNDLVFSGDYPLKAPMGADGNERTWEVRSEASPNPLVLVRSIQKIFNDYINERPVFMGYDWKAGGYPHYECPAGLHVHFGISHKKTNCEQASLFLSNYAGAISLLLEDKEESKKRRIYKNCEYGWIDNYRVKPWGWEYRTMSSSLVSPYVTTALLCLAKVVYYEFQNIKGLSADSYISPADFNQHKIAGLKENFPKLWKDIIKMKLYQTYKPYIDILYFLVTNNLTWYPKNKNLKESWGLTRHIVSNGVDMNAIWFKWAARKQS
jgi:hypothetical protein